jgi:hypothetical protein
VLFEKKTRVTHLIKSYTTAYETSNIIIAFITNLREAWRIVSSGMLRRVALVRTAVSENPRASFIRVTRLGELWTTLALTSNRRTQRATPFLGDLQTGNWPYRFGDWQNWGRVRYDHETRETEARDKLRWQGRAATVNYSPVLSSERLPHYNKRRVVYI